jgi:regulatory protein
MPKKKLTYDQAITKAMRLCSMGEKCTDDIRKKLLQWGIEQKDFSPIIDQLKKERFIDEQRFAMIFAQSKVRQNKWGKVKIAFALKQKNIPGHIIQQSLNNIDDQEYKSILVNELTKKLHSLEHIKDSCITQKKLLQFALNRGFEHHIVHKMTLSVMKNFNTRDDDSIQG